MVTLPQAQVVSPTRLIALQSLLPAVDLLLLRTFPHSSRTIKTCLLGYHSLIPLLVTTPNPAINLFLVPTPIFVCAQNLSLPTPLPPVKEIVNELCTTMLEPNPPPDASKVRQRAVLKLARAALKYGVQVALVPLLRKEKDLVELPWYSPISIANTLGYGAVLYCIVGMVTDVATGITQLIVNRDLMELMNKPFLAYSPRDFWSNRWNRIASTAFHRSVFTPNKAKSDSSKEKSIRRWNNSVAALSAFTVSGIFHELLVASLFRETRGENLAFFLLQAAATITEVRYLGSRYAPQGFGHIVSTSATFLWLGTTGRLFFIPFWRRNFFAL